MEIDEKVLTDTIYDDLWDDLYKLSVVLWVKHAVNELISENVPSVNVMVSALTYWDRKNRGEKIGLTGMYLCPTCSQPICRTSNQNPTGQSG